METPRQNRLEALFADAISLPPERRLKLLDRAAASDHLLRSTLDSLVAHDEHAPSFFDRLGKIVAQAVLNPAQPSAERELPEIPRAVSHFRILERLGDGGMGIVYKARDVRLDRLVALKFLRPGLHFDDQARARFLLEAKAASAIDHPNIGTIYEIGSTEPGPFEPDGQLFIAMAYYAGETLKEKIEHGPLPLEDVMDFAIQTARGLAEVHSHGIWHRDVKPANLIVTEHGLIKIVDFGLAKTAGTHLTKTNAAMGSAAYMSPEQSRGERVDHRTDIWSLGVVLYEMLTGQRPFKGDYEPAVLYSILNVDPDPVGSLRVDHPSELDAIVKTCLQKDPGARYQTALELQRDLRKVRCVEESPRPFHPSVRSLSFSTLMRYSSCSTRWPPVPSS